MSMRRSGVRWGWALTLAAACALLGATAFAQGRAGGQGGRAAGRAGAFGRTWLEPTASRLPIEVLDRALKLSADQKSKIQAIQDQARATMRQMMPQRTPGAGPARPDPGQMQQMMAKMQEQSKADSAKIEALLTPVQKKTLAKILADAKDYRLVGLPADATSALKLTPAQHEKIVAIAASVRKAMPQPGAGAAGGMAGFQAMRQAMQSARDQVQAVLTPDQRATLEKITPRRMGGFGGPGAPGGAGGGRGNRRGGRGPAGGGPGA